MFCQQSYGVGSRTTENKRYATISVESGSREKIEMCLAVPMELVEKDDYMGVAQLGDIRRNINLMLVPEAKVGDYVIIHAGSAISVLSEQEAKKTLALLDEIPDFDLPG